MASSPMKNKKSGQYPVFLYGTAVIVLLALALLKSFGYLDAHMSESRMAGTESVSASSETISVLSEAGEASSVNASGSALEETAGSSEDLEETTDDGDQVTLTISAAGDCTLGTDTYFEYSTSLNAMYEEKGPAYFMENVKDIFAEDDLTIVNFEGTLTTSDDRADKEFAFKGDPSYTEILTDGNIEAVNLANNHTEDYGTQGYEDTIANLDGAGITNFGYERTAMMEINGIKVGLCGIMMVTVTDERKQLAQDDIASLKEQGADLIIVTFHWGVEKATTPNSDQVEIAHAAIDAGADLVLGHHPHVLEGIEVYKGKNIVYSLGNFCFGGNADPSDKDTMIFQQTFTFKGGELQEDNVTNVIPCSLSSDNSYNDYQPTPAEGSEAQRISQKIEDLSSGLSES